MAKEYVPIFFEWLDVTQDLSPEEKGDLIDAVISYAAGLEYEQYLNKETRIAFRFLKGQVDRNTSISEARAKAGAAKREQQQIVSIKTEQPKTTENKPKQTETKEKQKRFVPPTLEEVKAYCTQRGNGVDAEQFIAFYASKGWKVGDQPMKDWKAAIITWEKRDRKDGKQAAKPLPAQSYTQRKYEPKDANRFYEDMLARQGGTV